MNHLLRYSRWASQLKNLNLQSSSFSPFTTTTTITTTGSDESTTSRPPPPPIQVLLTESAGRGVFAARRIESGELIHTAKPIVSHPSLSAADGVCYSCLKKLGIYEAQRVSTQGVSFCSVECQQQSKAYHEIEEQADWSAYKDYCSTQGLKYPLLAKRLACMVIAGAATADRLDILQPGLLSSEQMFQMEKEFQLLRRPLEEGHVSEEKIGFLTKEWYTGVLARIRINAFRIELAMGSYEDLLSLASASVESQAAVGNAVYMLPSFYNHDCDPNTHIVWIQNVDAKIKALRDIEAGEELRICYIDTSMDRDARRALLSQGFGFSCNCPRCLSGD